MASEKPRITIIPPNEVSQPPYANQTYMISMNQFDLNIFFMRLPMNLDEDKVQAAIQTAKSTITGDVVGSITLPRKVASDMATHILQALEATEGKEPGQ